MWILFFCVPLLCFIGVNAIEVATHMPPDVEKMVKDTRRILNGQDVTENRPYMVYLKLPRSNKKHQDYKTWLCGGAIIHEEYILTSAACIQDADHFYVVSGTYKYADEDDRYNNPCIRNGAKKAIWKCIPKNYVFDGHENDNIRWMNNDIAIVKVDEGFDFTRRIKGCDFVPKPVCYNNQSQTLENPGTVVSLAGWGSTSRYSDWVNSRRKDNQQNLLESRAEIISKQRCKRRWGPRYQNIIDNYMICTKDIGQTMSEICNTTKKEGRPIWFPLTSQDLPRLLSQSVTMAAAMLPKYQTRIENNRDCQDIDYSDEEETRRSERIPTNLMMHSAYNDRKTESNTTLGSRRYRALNEGGFCENDHGGPLIYGEGVNSIVIGVISACLVKENSNKCYGPFLYTSVFKNRQFISCAIYKDVEPKCRRQFRSGVTHDEKLLSWRNHPDGPAKNEMTSTELLAANVELVPRADGQSEGGKDKVFSGSGFILRPVNEAKEPLANVTVKVL